MLNGVVSLHDIDDVEAFVRASGRKTKLKLNGHEYDELILEGLAIIFDLAKKFKPHMEGYDQPGSFAGYCSTYLPRKMSAAWHRWHPEHLLVTQEDGKKRYVYGDTPASLDERWDDDRDVRLVGDFAH